MKTVLLSLMAGLGLLLLSVSANARESVNNAGAKAGTAKSQGPQYKADVGDCAGSTSEFELQINNVRALLLGGGDLWWNLTDPKYEVPKGNGTNPLCCIFAGALWISGLDAGGNLKCAAQRYRDYGNDFWPGPLTNGQVSQATCSQYDIHFNVFGADIAAAQAAFQQNGNNTTTAMIKPDVLAWPAMGNQNLLTNPGLLGQTFDITTPLAPFYDADGDGMYDPTKGDFPCIPCHGQPSTAYADQMVFWVFNDLGNIHTQTNGQALGIQVNALAFAFTTTDDINNMTFYSYQIVNQSSNPVYQTYVSQWVDPDNGCFSNDRVGCDTSRSLGFCYNGSTPDPDCQDEFGYGVDLPTVGVTFFEGPTKDNNQNLQIGMTSFVYFTNGDVPAKTDPVTAPQYRNYQTGFWADGTPFTEGNTGYGGTTPTKFLFPGNPSNSSTWSECSVASTLPPGDRRFVESSGPFTLKPGIAENVVVGVPFVRPPGNGVGLCPNTETTIGPVSDEGQALFNTCFQILNGPDAPTLQIRELNQQLIVNLVNLPGSNNFGESYNQVDGITAEAIDHYLGGKSADSTYSFRGYLLYQVTGPNVSATNLKDVTQALLVAQCDIVDNDSISYLINYIKDPVLGYVPTLEVTEYNKGITNSFNITTDLFATGSSNQLVNHLTYYYCAIAYAYNDYYPFTPGAAFGQQLPYLQGRNNFKVYSAIPHITDSRDGGTVLNSTWGEGVPVKRIEGQGNGGNTLQLSAETVTQILGSSTGFCDTLIYQPGGDPIGFQVTDPIALKEADFELQLYDTGRYVVRPGDTPNVTTVGPQTVWLLRDLTDNDTIYSDRAMDRPYQQQVIYNGVDYGFAVKLGNPQVAYVIDTNYLTLHAHPRNVYGANAAQSSLTYADSTKPWLSFVQEQGVDEVTNWIRSGTYAICASGSHPNALAGVFDDNWYYTAGNGYGTSPPFDSCPNYLFSDASKLFNNILNGTWAPYCLAANYANDYPPNGAPPYVYGPGFIWLYYDPIANTNTNPNATPAPPQNTLDRLQSVDVVITPETSLWSQCVVFETGEEAGINQGNALRPRSTTYNSSLAGDGAFKGEIRMAYSMDWNSSHTALVQNTTDTGRSWFPGYAINVETGQRLNIFFGESSDMGNQNGTDMLWNPTSNLYDPIVFTQNTIQQLPYFGGKHFIYVMETPYDGGVAAQKTLLTYYDSIKKFAATGQQVPKAFAPLYQQIMWTSIPYLTPGYSFVADGVTNNPAYIPPSTVTIKLRVQKPFDRFATSATIGTDTMPRYQFSTKGLGATVDNLPVAKNALDEIRIVPNPYLAYSAYETNALSGAIEITNLPNTCTVSIYSLDGQLINVLQRAVGTNNAPASDASVETTSGVAEPGVNTENSITWNMTNKVNVPIASGIYLFHITAPGIGDKTLKWFGAIRPNDITDF